jgi:hypothetical protein
VLRQAPPLWKTRQIDSRTVEGTNKAYLDELVATYGEDSDIVKVRVRGMFPSTRRRCSSSATDQVEAARKREVIQADPFDPLVIGVDVARFGDDSSTIYFRRGRDARTIRRSSSTASTRCSSPRRWPSNSGCKAALVCVDEGGIGAGVVDGCKQMGARCGVQFGGKPLGAVRLGRRRPKVANRRAEMWAIMREWLKAGRFPTTRSWPTT